MKRAVIIDDESDSREVLKYMLGIYCPEITVAGMATGVEDGFSIIHIEKPDIVFLDIQLDGNTGFEILNKFNSYDFKVIFVTAHNEYALKAFNYNTFDYLLKPITASDLVRAVNKITSSDLKNNEIADNINISLPSFNEDRLCLQNNDGLTLVELQDIVRIEGEANYSRIFLENGLKIVHAKGLKSFEEVLPTDRFFRIHQSHIINIRYVNKVISSDLSVMLKDKTILTIARRKKAVFLEWLSLIMKI